MPEANVTRTSTEFSLTWADSNPALFVDKLRAFQTEYPVTIWRHYIDLGRTGFVTFTASRRAVPYDSMTDYLADGRGNVFLRETGQHA